VEHLPAGVKHLEACTSAQFELPRISACSYGRLQHLLFGCFPVSRHSIPVSNYDQSRAALVLWLSFHDLDINVSVVNAALDTAIHCATRSNSPLTLQVCILCNNSIITMKVLARNMGSPAHALLSPQEFQTQTHKKAELTKQCQRKRLHLLTWVNAVQALLITAAGTGFLTKGCLSQRNIQEQQALDLALHGRQWHAVQLLVTAGKASF